MSFTSGKRAQLGLPPVNHDPHPNVWEGHSERDQMRTDTDMFRRGAPIGFPNYAYRPRPEFAVLDNPVLAEFRGRLHYQELVKHPVSAPALAAIWVTELHRHICDRRERTSGCFNHARRVLEKLAALS